MNELVGWRAFFFLFLCSLSPYLGCVGCREYLQAYPITDIEYLNYERLFIHIIGSVSGICAIIVGAIWAIKAINFRYSQEEDVFKFPVPDSSPFEEPIKLGSGSLSTGGEGDPIQKDYEIGEFIERKLIEHFNTYPGPLSLQNNERMTDIKKRCLPYNLDQIVSVIKESDRFELVKGRYEILTEPKNQLIETKSSVNFNPITEAKYTGRILAILNEAIGNSVERTETIKKILSIYPEGQREEGYNFVLQNYSHLVPKPVQKTAPKGEFVNNVDNGLNKEEGSTNIDEYSRPVT